MPMIPGDDSFVYFNDKVVGKLHGLIAEAGIDSAPIERCECCSGEVEFTFEIECVYGDPSFDNLFPSPPRLLDDDGLKPSVTA